MGWLEAAAPIIGSVIGGVGSYLGGKAQSDAYGQAASAAQGGTDRAIQAQMDMFNTLRNDTSPLRDLLPGTLQNLIHLGRGTVPAERQYMDQYAGIGIPSLQNEVNVDYGSDPIYQAQQAEMERMLNRRFASQGRSISSDADNALIRNTLPFMQDAYGRAESTLNRTNQNALTQYGLGTQRAQTLYGMEGALGDQAWGRNLDLAKLGAGAAASAGQGAQTTGNALSSLFQSGGNTMAGILGNQGNNTAQMYGNMAGSVSGGINNSILYDILRNQKVG